MSLLASKLEEACVPEHPIMIVAMHCDLHHQQYDCHPSLCLKYHKQECEITRRSTFLKNTNSINNQSPGRFEGS